ncbi:MAG: hypothetical protein KDB80_14245 [Planctomycetes bacterium]|nr:hypothetical protein [Planctomycetota bacterium]
MSIGVVTVIASSGKVPESALTALWTGVIVAVLASALGLAVLARCVTVPNDDPARTTQLYLIGLASNLGLQGLCVVVGMVLFSFGDEKFPGLAAFGLTFAAVAGLMQVLGSVSISRFLRGRAAAAAAHGSEGSS